MLLKHQPILKLRRHFSEKEAVEEMQKGKPTLL
jgi:hypothetical protein